MSSQLTVLAAGGATVPASGNYTALGLSQVQAIFNQASMPGNSTVVTFDPLNPTIPAVPPADFGNYVLIVPNSATQPLTLAIPSGYGAVILGRGTNATVTGGDATTRIVSGGLLDYTGAAALVDASAGSGRITDSAANAIVEVGGGAYSVTATGHASTIRVDNGSPDFIDVRGGSDSIQLGNGPPSGTYFDLYQFAASVSGATVRTALGDVVTVNGTGYTIVDNATGAGATTINALWGSSTVFAGTGDLYQGQGGSAVTEYIGTGANQTVFGGSGNDTVFGQAGDIVYNQGSGAFSYFIAGSGNATVNGSVAGGGAVFGGTGNTYFTLGNSNDVFVGGSGHDTIVGGAAIPTVFGGSHETVVIQGSHVAFVVALGEDEVMDASGALGGTNFFALGSQGNVTLIGNPSSGVPDTFQIQSVPGGRVHTVDIQNWHTGDGLFLTGYGQADRDLLDATLNAGGTTFTLSDGTTIRFDGAHPTHGIGGVGF